MGRWAYGLNPHAAGPCRTPSLLGTLWVGKAAVGTWSEVWVEEQQRGPGKTKASSFHCRMSLQQAGSRSRLCGRESRQQRSLCCAKQRCSCSLPPSRLGQDHVCAPVRLPEESPITTFSQRPCPHASHSLCTITTNDGKELCQNQETLPPRVTAGERLSPGRRQGQAEGRAPGSCTQDQDFCSS